MGGHVWLRFFLLVLLCLSVTTKVQAEEVTEEDMREYFDFEEINGFFEEREQTIRFSELVGEFAGGDFRQGSDRLFGMLKEELFCELRVHKEAMKKILALAFVTALFTNFAAVFKNSQVSDMGFLICYIAMISYLMGSFMVLSGIAYEVLGGVMDFMRALLPVYAVSVSVSDGQANASAFYEMALLVIGIAEFVSLKLLFPAINLYASLSMVNHLGKEDYLSKSCALIKSVVDFVVKAMLTIVMGLNIIQRMFSPLTGAGSTAARNMVNTMAGISFTGNGIAELLYGTAKIMKSSIGGAGVVALCVLMLVPMVKMMVFVLSYRIIEALVQPVSDQRITACISSVHEGAGMFLHVVFATLVMFVLTITIITLV